MRGLWSPARNSTLDGTLRGHVARAEYWWFLAFGVSVNVAGTVTGIRPLLYRAAALLVVPQTAVTVRRLHDTNRSGWWILLYLAGLDSGGWILGTDSRPGDVVIHGSEG